MFIDARRNLQTSSFRHALLGTARRAPTEYRRARVSPDGFRKAKKVRRHKVFSGTKRRILHSVIQPSQTLLHLFSFFSASR
jgi:hypothetical protein